MRSFLLLPLLALLLLAGCEGADLHTAEQAGTPEALQAFIDKYPNSMDVPRLQRRIETYAYTAAKEAGTAEALRGFLAAHPEGEHAQEAARLEDELSFDAAKQANSEAGYEAYLKSHPEGQFVKPAKKAMTTLEWLPKLTVSELVTNRINMANDPEGPLNGWELLADVTNNGERTLSVVEMTVDYLDAAGKSVREDVWWAVTPDLSGFPVRPEQKKPLPKGQSRQFRFTTAERPEGFADRFGLRITEVRVRQ